MNRPAEMITNGAAKRRSFLYKPGATNSQIWYSIHGDAIKTEQSSGSFIQMMVNASIGLICTSVGGSTFNSLRAATAGCATTFHNSAQNVRQRMNAMPKPDNIYNSRLRRSSRCPRKDIRSIPSSSSSSSSSGLGGVGGVGGGGADCTAGTISA